VSGPRHRHVAALLGLLGLLLALAALVGMIHHFQDRVLIYDEGLLLTNAYLISTGAVPFRDFYSVYPPGVYYLIAGVWKVLGTSVSAARLLGFLIHLVIAACSGRLAGLAAGRRFSLFAAGVVLLWLSPHALQPYAWLAALAMALLATTAAVTWTERWLPGPQSPSSGRIPVFGTGLLLGTVSCFRHDLFAYLVMVLAAVFVAAWLSRRIPLPVLTRNLTVLAGGATMTVILFWLPTLARGGVQLTLGDLYFNLSRYVMPGREYPLTLDGPAPIAVMAALLLCLTAPVAAGGLALLARGAPRQFTAMVLLGALSLATLPQMLRRFDGWHILYTAPPAVAVFGAFAERLAGKGDLRTAVRGLLVAALICFLGWPIIPPASQWVRTEWPSFEHRYSGMPAYQYEWRREVLAFIAEYSQPGEPIFVGNSQHRRANFNDLTLYYLAERPGATRYLQFDPGQVTREEIQREMIAQLEASRPRVAVLLEGGYNPEPNRSSIEGASLLDEYIQSHYGQVATAGVYRMLLRKP